MPNPAVPEDIESRWRPLTDAEALIAQTLLDDAWQIAVTRRPDLEANIQSGKVAQANVVRILAAMVIRVLSNPEGILEESIDDYRYRRDSLVSSGALSITPEELADLTVGGSKRSSSVRLVAYGDR